MAQEIDEEKVYCEIDENTDFADDTIMVVLTNKVSLSTKRYTVADFPEISCVEVTDLTEELWQEVINHQHSIDCNPERETKTESFNRILKLTISNPGKSNVVDAIRKLEKRDDVKAVDPNYNCSSATIPDDTYYESKQWGIDKINLPKAWDIETGSDTVLVGVIDSGIDGNHPDLENRINKNLSKDFTENSGKYENNPFEDNDGHGTHVAGIIGAEGNNNTGITGVCWNISLVSLKIMNESEDNKTDKVAKAINYAAQNNIYILNISYMLPNSTALKEAVENYPGLIVTSACNNNLDIDQKYVYPACYPYDNVLTVGASTSTDEKSSFSNFGLVNVDIFAPGSGIYSIVPLNYGDKTGYAYKSGTSMATPFVTGVAALLLSKDNTLSPTEIKKSILYHCDELDAFNGKCVSGGRLNAYKVLKNSHNFQSSYKDSTTHTKNCKCGYSVDTAHSFINHVCVDCGYYTESHTYNTNYTWVNYTHHNATCSCGDTTMQVHAVAARTLAQLPSYDKCLFCGGPAKLGIVKYGMTDKVQLVTKNGSYVLPNGVIVLVDEDIEAYIRGTLVFISCNSK